MSQARLASGFDVGALRRLAEMRGGTATMVRRGDDERGQILLCLTERGVYSTFLERTLVAEGTYQWQRVGPTTDKVEKSDSFVERRAKYDPDLWIIDLDIPDCERFIAEIVHSG